MGRRGNGYGSEDHFIHYRADNPDRLNNYISEALPNSGRIDWLYPEHGVYEEPKDLAFMPLSESQLRFWNAFWPNPGNRRWDGVARCNDEWLLFEAKANEAELRSPGTVASPGSLRHITAALDEVKNYLGVPAETVWHKDYYQYANRLAVLYFLNVKVKIPARLVFLYFTGDVFPDGRPCPRDDQDWRPLIQRCHEKLRLPTKHPLGDRMHEVFVPVQGHAA